VACAEAAILSAAGRGVRVRAVAASFNHDAQERDGLQTGLADVAPRLWAQSGLGPDEIDVFELYDDYPVVVLMQLADLGVAAPDEAVAKLRGPGGGGLAVNTGGGLLCAGQAGAAGGLQGFVEGVRQLRGERGDGQVAHARTALVSGYGMVLYRWGAASVAAVLDDGASA
jgi:acetyl-CoA acetyltransferase